MEKIKQIWKMKKNHMNNVNNHTKKKTKPIRKKSVDFNSSIKLSFLTPIENINEESSVKIKCSSSNSMYIL